MANRRANTTQEDDPNAELYDAISEEDAAQAEAGTLFSVQGDQFANVQWSIYRLRTRREIVDDPSGEKQEWVTDVAGELRGQDLVEMIGGGTFRFYGYVPRPAPHNGVRLAYNRVIRLAGPRRDFTYVAPAVASPPGASATTEIDRRMERLERMLETLTRAPAAPAAPPFTEMIQGLATLDQLRGRGVAANPDKELFGSMFAIFEKGIELGTARDPVPAEDANGAGTVLKIVETVAPLFARVMEGAQARRRAYQPPPAAPTPGTPPPNATPGHTPTEPATPSHAQVVDPPDINTSRMMVAIDELARGMMDQDPPDEVADTVLRVLPDQQVDMMLAMADEEIVDQIVANASGAYPAMATPEGRAYLAAVVVEIRKAEDPASPPSA